MTTKQLQPRDIDGKYNYGTNWDRKCECSHRLGNHLANKPRNCNECECVDFKTLLINK